MKAGTGFAVLLAGTMLGGAAWAVPSTVAFTGKLADASGPVTGSVNLDFALYPTSAGGSMVWVESDTTIADTGLVYSALGSMTPLDETILDGSTLYLEITVNGTTMTPRTPVRSVPYAIRAGDADTLGGASASDFMPSAVGTCGPGSAISAIGTTGLVTCETDDNTTYTAAPGGGLTLSGTSFSVDGTAVLGPIGTCAVGSSIRDIAPDGTVTCETDDNTTYTVASMSGLTMTGTVLGTDLTVLQHRLLLSPGCSTGNAIRDISSTGAVTCEDITPYTAGAGVTFSGTGSTTIDADPTEFNGASPAARSTSASLGSVTGTGYVSLNNVSLSSPAGFAGRIVAIGNASFQDTTPGSGGVGVNIGLDTDEAGTPTCTSSIVLADLGLGSGTVTCVFTVAGGAVTTIYIRGNSDAGEATNYYDANVTAWFIPN